jgi:hypothetical protein
VANSFLTITQVTYEALRLFLNNLSFTRLVDTSYSKQYGNAGKKIGDTLQIRLDSRFVGTVGATYAPEDIIDRQVPLTINTQRGVHLGFTSKDFALSLDDFSERYLKAAMATLANQIDLDGLTLYKTIPNATGTPGTIPNTLATYLNAGAVLSDNAAPLDEDRALVINPWMNATIVNALSGLFNDQNQVGKQYVRGRMGTAAGFDWYIDQNVNVHTVGPLGGTPLVNGATQTGSTLITDGWTAAAAARLKKGDVITIAGVFHVNPQSKVISPGQLQQFTVTADLSSDGSGNATIPIYPAITTSGAYQTVTASPADNAAITVLGAASTNTPQGIAFHKMAFALVSVPLPEPNGVHMVRTATDPASGISIRILQDYDHSTDQIVTRAEVLYGWGTVRPEWAVRIAS